MILANFAIPALNLNFINTANQLNLLDRIINIHRIFLLLSKMQIFHFLDLRAFEKAVDLFELPIKRLQHFFINFGF